MKHEHKFSPAVAEFAAKAVAQIEECRRQYLMLLGQAKEAELRSETLRLALAQQMALVEATENLPRPLGAYQLSADQAGMWAEVADPPPAAAPRRVNGSPAIEVRPDAG